MLSSDGSTGEFDTDEEGQEGDGGSGGFGSGGDYGDYPLSPESGGNALLISEYFGDHRAVSPTGGDEEGADGMDGYGDDGDENVIY